MAQIDDGTVNGPDLETVSNSDKRKDVIRVEVVIYIPISLRSNGLDCVFRDTVDQISSFWDRSLIVFRSEYSGICQKTEEPKLTEAYMHCSRSGVLTNTFGICFLLWLSDERLCDIGPEWCKSGLPWRLRILHSKTNSIHWQSHHQISTSGKVQIAFGNLIEPTVFSERMRFRDASLRMDHSMQKIHMYVVQAASQTSSPELPVKHEGVKLNLPYNAIKSCSLSFRDGSALLSSVDVTLHLRKIPLVWKLDIDGYLCHRNHKSRDINFSEVRVLDRVIAARGSGIFSFDAGRCLCIQISINDFNQASLSELIERFSFKMNIIGAPIFFCEICRVKLKFGRDMARNEMINLFSTFEGQYAMACPLFWSDEIIEQLRNRGTEEIKKVSKLILDLNEENGAEVIAAVLVDVFHAIENGPVIDFILTMQSLADNLKYSTYSTAQLQIDDLVVPGTTLVRRMFVTPLRMILRPPEHHMENRILREFHRDQALRVSFRDDDFQKLTFASRESVIFAVVSPFLTEGLSMGTRLYKSVAASSSQLRDHGVWFYAQDREGNDANTIRAWMGDFKQINNIATKMARMGQCFSSTQKAVVIDPDKEEFLIDDITYPGIKHSKDGKPYVFTDGCGTISRQLLEEVWKACKLKWKPSAIQIRYKGCKGMLCLDPTLEGRKICIRPSMTKFKCSSSNALEVIRGSKPMTVTLNRPLITLLEFLGVPIDVFMKLQQTQLLELTDAFVNEYKAAQYLRKHCWRCEFPFGDMLRSGWSLIADQFCCRLILGLLKKQIQCLKEKTNIALDPNMARNLYGVCDETGTLEYGEVFIQYTEWPFSLQTYSLEQVDSFDVLNELKLAIVEGPVVVTKCPCYHPGDARRLTAVDRPELRHIRDCIVFSVKGPRPMASEMSGSDLDGDEFLAIWKQELIFEHNYEAYTYPDNMNGLQRRSNRNFQNESNFFCQYITDDIVGPISNSHLALADSRGLLSPECLNLVDKASLALDFAKTGVSVFLDASEKPSKYPDFMEKGNHKPSYESTKALGHLYRTVVRIMSVQEVKLNLANGLDKLADWEVPGWKDFAGIAEETYRNYRQRLYKILIQDGIQSESELFTGNINFNSESNVMRLDRENVEMLVERQRDVLITTTRRLFFEQALQLASDQGAIEFDDLRFIQFRLACAWFRVCYYPTVKEDFPSYSFPWCIANVLIQARLWMNGHGYQNSFDTKRSENVLVDLIDNQCVSDGRAAEDLALENIRFWLKSIVKRKKSAILPLSLDSDSEDESSEAGRAVAETPKYCDCLKNMFNKILQNELKRKLSCGKLVIAFLRKAIKSPELFKGDFTCHRCRRWKLLESVNSPSGNQSCSVSLLSSEATRVYMTAAVNKDICFLNLPCVQNFHSNSECTISDAPPEVIRITERFYKFLEKTKGEEFKRMLRFRTGASYIHLEYSEIASQSSQPLYQMKVHYSGTLSGRLETQAFLRDKKSQSLFTF